MAQTMASDPRSEPPAVVRLEEVTVIRAPIERCFDLARSVEVHLAHNVHSGEAALAIGGVPSGLIGLRQRGTWRGRHFGARHALTRDTTALPPGTHFPDT